MKLSHIEHIGIAVENLENSIKFYEKIFELKCLRIDEVPDQEVRTAFFQIGATKIELLESVNPDGPVGKFIKKRGEGIHHIALAVSNITEFLKRAEVEGVILIDSFPRKGAEGRDVAFLHPKSTSGVLIELCEI
jgi:methylmalonyl-CoA/ethylmalonyl-CoA epimerase